MTGQGRDPAFLAVRDLTKRFGGLTAVSDATFDVREGSITGLIGRIPGIDLIIFGVLLILVVRFPLHRIPGLLAARWRGKGGP